MNRDEALRLLRGGEDGVREWNRLVEDGESPPDLQDAFLINADLRGIDLRGALLVGASLRQADLRCANLSGAQLNGADLRGADLRWAHLRHTNLSGALFGGTLIACDLSGAGGLNSTIHLSRSVIDVASILQLRSPLPETFLRGCGLPREEIVHFRERVQRKAAARGCFICYSTADEGLAHRLHDDFQSAGLRCWKWNYDTHFCDQVLDDPDVPVGPLERLLLIASRHSLVHESVNLEIERAVEEEERRELFRRNGRSSCSSDLLHLVRADDFIFQTTELGRPLWDHPCRDAVVNRTIVDAVGWDHRPGKYGQVRQDLIHALTSE